MISHRPALNGDGVSAPNNGSKPEPGSETHARWSTGRFYWAILDAPLRRPGPLPPGLMLDLQDHVPLDVTALHAVGVPLGASDGSGGFRTLACAVPRESLRELPGSLAALTPVTLPAGIAPGANVELLNFLVGEFEPRSDRRRRTLMHAVAMAGTLMLALLVLLGLSRRATALHREIPARTEAGPPARCRRPM